MRNITFFVLLAFCLFGLIYSATLIDRQFRANGTVNMRVCRENFAIAHIDNWEQIGGPGKPILPAFPIRIELEGRYNIDDIRIYVSRWEEIAFDDSIIILPGETIIPRLPENRSKSRQFIPDEAIYTTDVFFPISNPVTKGFDGGQTIISALVMAKYNPVRNILRIPRMGTIVVSGEFEPEQLFGTAHLINENIIIAPPELSAAAESLAALHEDFGTSSAVFLTDWISAEYDTTPVPLLPGYPETTPEFSMDYNMELAQDIVSFIRDYTEHPNLESITLLGDADQIPPSFYYYVGYWADDWGSFVPTDFFYASPYYDWIPQYSVGRLPVHTNDEALDVIDKLSRWHEAADEDNFGKMLLAGGKPFSGIFFDDEHSVMNIANTGAVANAEWHKLYTTRESFSLDSFEVYYDEEWGFICELGHGSGYGIYFDDDSDWGVAQLEILPERDFSPIIFAGVCLGGLFDQEIIPDIGSGETFPEAAIKSPGGPIALFATTRSSFGAAISSTDGGIVTIESEEYITEMGYLLAQELPFSPATMGEWYKNAVEQYTTRNDMGDASNIETVLEFILHGDPALPLPDFPSSDIAILPELDLPEESYMTLLDYNELPAYHGAVFTCGIMSANEAYFSYILGSFADLIRTTTGITIDMSPETAGMYHISADGVSGAESRAYLLESTGDIIIDGLLMDWIFFSHSPVAEDPIDFEEEWLEMRNLYVTVDNDFLYIGFDVETEITETRTYQVALDFAPGGYSGTLGYTTDPSFVYVCFPGEHGIDAVASMYFWSDYGWPPTIYPLLFGYESGAWDEGAYFSEIGATYSNSLDFLELSIPVEYFGSADEVSIIVYSAPDAYYGEYPAQDCVPPDSEAYHSLTEGSGNANLLSNFITITLPSEIKEKAQTPERISLAVAPNPFNSCVRIQVSGNGEHEIEIEIFDLKGNKIAVCDPTDNRLPTTDNHFVVWKPDESITSGIYLVRAKSDGQTITRRIIYLK